MTGAVVALDRTTTGAPGFGGKGASLARMIAGGLRVPATAMITAQAYRRVVEEPELRTFLDQVATAATPPDGGEVNAAFERTAIPVELADQIVDAARQLGDRVAVRSSGSSEDLPEQSFAGQYTSFLDVPSEREPLLRAVRLVWASLWQPAPWAYRRAWGIPDADATMSVVLMAMVPAVEAGVVFTADPGGAPGTMRIEAVAGLGEALVSGQRTPSVWLVPSDPGAPLPATAPAHLTTVRDQALALERSEGAPLDIEWAWDGTDVWLVQSRPVTIAADDGDGFDSPVDDHELTTEGIAEMLPGVLPPLQWAVSSFLVEEAFRSVLAGLGALPEAAAHRPFVRRVRGQAAMDLDLLKQSAAAIPGVADADIERQYFGEVTDAATAEPAGAAWWRFLRRDLRAAGARRQARIQGDTVVAAVEEMRRRAPDVGAMDDHELLAYRLRVLHLALRAMTAELGVAAAAAAAYSRLEQVLDRYLDDADARRWAQLLTTGAGRAAPPSPTASRSVFGGPTWAELEARPAHDGVATPDPAAGDRRSELEATLSRDPRWRRTRVLSGQLVDVRLHLLRRMIADAVEDLRRRELVKAAVLELGGHVRGVHLECGRRLTARGLLPSVDDIDLLGEVELRVALQAGRGVPQGLLGRRRRWLANRRSDDLLPSRFRGRPAEREAPVPDGDRWTGLAASPGRFTGPAVVVDDPTGPPPPPGAVIVARTTDAAWSPLFVDAGAIVVERGGPLSHAAIVARELGVPAVLDVHGATRALGGRVVTVDGDRGLVVVHAADEQVVGT